MDLKSKKTVFRALLKDLDFQRFENDPEAVCEVEPAEDLPVRVYYVRDEKEGEERPTFAQYLHSVENCRNLCDIRLTYKTRNSKVLPPEDFLILTPSDETTTRVK